MTDFGWLTGDRMVQKTVFGDGTVIIANFGTRPATDDGVTVPAGTVIARQGDATTSYTPAAR
jgi:hypothetical protein